MTNDDLELDGVTLTLDECKKVLEWVAEPWTRKPDRLITLSCGRLVLSGPPTRYLTPERIKRIRDHAEPWTMVRRDEVKPGEVFLAEDAEQMATDGRRDNRGYMRSVVLSPCDPLVSPGEELEYFTDDTVRVRRPRKPALTLRDVKPGQRFRFVGSQGYVHRRTVTGWLEEATWMHADIRAAGVSDALVKVVE